MTSSPNPDELSLKLYITGSSPKSLRAHKNLLAIVADHFEEDVDIEVIDLIKSPGRAREDQIVAIPTLVRSAPLPRAQIVGDLSNIEKVLRGMGLDLKGSA